MTRHRSAKDAAFGAQGRLRRGYTLVELSVGVFIGGLVLVLLWSMYAWSARLFRRTRDRLDSLQGAHVLLEMLHHDLSRAYVDPTQGIGIDVDLDPISKASSIGLFAPDPARSSIGAAGPRIALERVEYRFDPADSSVHFRTGGRQRRFPLSRFESVAFGFIKPANLGSTTGASPQYNNYAVFRITCASDEEIDMRRGMAIDDPRRYPIDAVTLVSAVGMHQKASQDLFPVWQPVPILEVVR